MDVFVEALLRHWPSWLITVVMVVAAVIDGWQLKVPNWLTFPMVLSGVGYSSMAHGWEGFSASLMGTVVGLLLLLPAYAIGGMGAGDVKLLAGVGAWMYAALEAARLPIGTATAVFHAFVISAFIGAALAIGMVVWKKAIRKHWQQFWAIVMEIWVIRNPQELAHLAAQRKSQMLLLPYGIPLAMGTIAYLAWMGMLV